MSGKQRPGICGPDLDDEPIDAGTGALVCMPPPVARQVSTPPASSTSDGALVGVPVSGVIPYAAGLAGVVRIPIPGTNGLGIELTPGPRAWTPKGGTTSAIFFQDEAGRRMLRLDYGFNKVTETIDYHWNQKGTKDVFGVTGHTPAGRGAGAAFHVAKAFHYAGRRLIVLGAVLDGISIVEANRPLRRASQVVAGWAAAWVGCKVVGAGGAAAGLLASPLGSVVGGFGGCIIGSVAFYQGGALVAGEIYDWSEDTFFKPLPEAPAPTP